MQIQKNNNNRERINSSLENYRIKCDNIKNSFNKAAKTYDKHCYIQNVIFDELLNILPKNNYNIIADYACGTAINTNKLFEIYQPKKCFAIDIADKLLEIAKNKYNNTSNMLKDIKFIEANFDEKIFIDNYLDLAISNMGLQWSIDLNYSSQMIKQQLNKNGVLAFSMPVSGTFEEIDIKYRNNFYQFADIKEILCKAGFTNIITKQKKYILNFNDPYEALNSIKRVGANIKKDLNISTSMSNLLGKTSLNSFFTGNNYDLSYNIGYFVGIKI